jgi:hypothetical protein
MSRGVAQELPGLGLGRELINGLRRTRAKMSAQGPKAAFVRVPCDGGPLSIASMPLDSLQALAAKIVQTLAEHDKDKGGGG